jgi:putative colanic acid biosynthesis acetyltransferase WcaF
MKTVKLKNYDNSWYEPGGALKRVAWYFVNMFFFSTMLPFPSGFKVRLLRLFGAEVGENVVIKPSVNSKYPWFLRIGSDVWIGENVWIDSLADITIGDDVVLSQGAYLLTGSHDYKSEAFDLVTKPIVLENGVWIGAQATVCPGVRCESHSVLAVGSVATKDLDAYGIYQGNPAQKKRERTIA